MTTPQQTCLEALQFELDEIKDTYRWSTDYRNMRTAEIEAAIKWVKEQSPAPFSPEIPESKNVGAV
jgi:hypothetical protein